MNEIKTTNDKITKLKITPLKLLIPTINKEKVTIEYSKNCENIESRKRSKNFTDNFWDTVEVSSCRAF